ncbi:MAG: adenylosuccinate lyase [bacterium]
MIARYSRQRMARIWEPEAKYDCWLRIEKLVCEAYAKEGVIPWSAWEAIDRKASFSIARIEEIEKVTNHDVIAFLTAVGESVGGEARYLHLGMTSSDVLDTALAVQLRDAADLILEGIDELMAVIREKAFRYKDTPMIGRTHGVHAEPITFGFKMAVWYEEMSRSRDRMRRAREVVSVGKISGAVGTFATIPPSIEAHVCRSLGLRPAAVSTQILQRDRHAELFCALAVLASSLEKFALEIRHLQRTEVREAEEFFAEGQKGSSAMPHKRNPIGSENICGLARVVRSHATAALENIPLWHERDISHSSVERVIAPDSTILVDYMLHRMRGLVRNLLVYPARMQENLGLTRGLIFSQEVLLELVAKGLAREDAYRLVQRNAMKAWQENLEFFALCRDDPEIGRHLSSAELEGIFQTDRSMRYIDAIFERVFGSPESAGNRKEEQRDP